MPRSEARLKVAIWANPDWRRLSHDAQWLYMTLLSQPDISLCGVIAYVPQRWQRLAGDTVDIDGALAELETDGFVEVDLDTFEVLIRTFVVHDGVMRSPNTQQAMWKSFDGIMSEDLAHTVLDTIDPQHVATARERSWSQRLSDCLEAQRVTDLNVSESLISTPDNTDSDSNSYKAPPAPVDNTDGRRHWRNAAARHLGPVS